MSRGVSALLSLVAALSAGACRFLDAPASTTLAVPAESSAMAPLGATLDVARTAVTFRVYSAHATRLEVDLYALAQGADEVLRLPLAAVAPAGNWAVNVPTSTLAAAGLTGQIYYGYRAWGPNWPYDGAWSKGSLAGWQAEVDGLGNRFDPNKLLLDPYAREVSHDPVNALNADAAYFATDAANRARDTGRVAPKGLVLADTGVDVGVRPTRALADDVVYEVHLRGFTKGATDVAEACRGTYAGAAEKAAYLRDLGVTAVEFLPVQEAANDQNDLAMSTKGANYWAYGSLNYFAPDRRYACDRTPGGPTREVQAMVRAFHEAGLKVFIDVVYNHTGERGTLSYRGLDNQTYYLLGADRRTYQKVPAVPGAALNAANDAVRDLVMTSLDYWRGVLGVDGFRFDLAPLLGNTCEAACFSYSPADPRGVLQRALAELPVRPAAGGAGVDLIAEPWGPAYELGHFPVGWAQWNGKFRDAIRTTLNVRGAATPGEVLGRLAGSAELFADRGWAASVNFLDCHDGFTLRDLNTYRRPNNARPWPFGPSDGGSTGNLSSDHGGDAGLQERAARSGLALAMTAVGVPMLAGGDEFYRTQFGNNNAYNLDTAKNWLDWTLRDSYADFAAEARSLVQLRQAHPALRGDPAAGGGSVAAYRADGQVADAGYLGAAANEFLGWRRTAGASGDAAASLYVAYNWGPQAVAVMLPGPADGRAWHLAGDTAGGPAATFAPAGQEQPWIGRYQLSPLAVAVFVER